MIDLSRPVAVKRPGVRGLLYRPATNAFVVAAALLAVAGSYVASHPPQIVHTVQVGISAYPAAVTASWLDPVGVRHSLDPWSGDVLHLPARAVTVVVAAPAQCDVIVDGHTDAHDPVDGYAVCQWVA